MFLTKHFLFDVVLASSAMAACVCCSGVLSAATVVWDFDSELSPSRTQNATATMTYFDCDPDAPGSIDEATAFGVTGGPGDVPPDMADGPAHYLHHGPLPDDGPCGYAIDHAGFQACQCWSRSPAVP